jgi:hypothetical protein
MTVRDAIALLEAEIAEKKTLLAALKSAVGAPKSNGAAETSGGALGGQAALPSARQVPAGRPLPLPAAAALALKEAGKPMHALHELLPLLAGRGVKVSNTTLPTALSRAKNVRKISPGVWAYDGSE